MMVNGGGKWFLSTHSLQWSNSECFQMWAIGAVDRSLGIVFYFVDFLVSLWLHGLWIGVLIYMVVHCEMLRSLFSCPPLGPELCSPWGGQSSGPRGGFIIYR